MVELRRAMSCLAVAAALVAISWPQPAAVSVTELLRPIELYRPIPNVAGGYRLAELGPSRDGDVLLLIMNDAYRIEMHILDRGTWTSAARTPSFDVGWEAYG